MIMALSIVLVNVFMVTTSQNSQFKMTFGVVRQPVTVAQLNMKTSLKTLERLNALELH